jgi:hypothetical protein
MVMLKKKSVLLVKAETVYGTDPTPGPTTDALLVNDANIKEAFGVVERTAQWSFLDTLPSVLGEQYVELSFKVDICGSGTPGTGPRVGALLKACGLAATNSPGVSDTYTVSSGSHVSVTIYLYMDGRQYVVTGCRGKSAKMVWTAGQPLVAEFTMVGLYTAATAAAIPGTVTYESTVKLPSMCKSSAFAYNSKTTLVTNTVELDFGIVSAKRPSVSASTGVAGFEITGFNPKCTIDPECQVETSYTFRADQLATTRALTVKSTRAAGNICTLNVPTFLITKIEYADRDGVLVEKVEGECAAGSGNDAFNIVFT